jgi:hypothetical protein
MHHFNTRQAGPRMCRSLAEGSLRGHHRIQGAAGLPLHPGCLDSRLPGGVSNPEIIVRLGIEAAGLRPGCGVPLQ